jgi:hypothetical protein
MVAAPDLQYRVRGAGFNRHNTNPIKVDNFLTIKNTCMKKYLTGILAAVLAIVLSSYTAPKNDQISFHFIPANGSETTYENPIRWEVAYSSGECTGPENDVCILRIDEGLIYSYSGSPTEQLAAYLHDQGVVSIDFESATHAVSLLTYSKKP